MNFFDDAFRYFSQLNKEASAKHILIKGPDGEKKCLQLKQQLVGATDVSASFSELAAQVISCLSSSEFPKILTNLPRALQYSECPSANRGGALGTFKPGMMVKEFDNIVFSEKVGVVHGPIVTQFGNHLIFITRRYEGGEEKK